VNPNTEWVARTELPAALGMKRERVARRTAHVLGVPLEEIVVVETVGESGIGLVAHWLPQVAA
jgi:hypothetical protein